MDVPSLNCRRAGGRKIQRSPPPQLLTRHLILVDALAYSINYIVGEDQATLSDPQNSIKTYADRNTKRGQLVHVSL